MTTMRVFVAPRESSSSRACRGQRRQVAGVEPDARRARGRRPRPRSGCPGRRRRCRPAASSRGPSVVDLGAERGLLVVVQQREGVRAGAAGGDAVAPAGLEVGRRREADQVGGPGRGDRGLLVGAARAHLDARPLAGGGHHAGGGRGDGAVVVEHREGQGLQQHALGERRPDGEHGGAGEVEVALGVAVDVAGEPEVGQPVEQPLVGDALLAQGRQLVVPEPEVRQRLQQPAGAGQHAVAPAVRQPAGEDLEDAVAARRCRRPGRRRPSSARSGR